MENSIKCICCGFEIKPIMSEFNDDLKPEQGMWDGGTVEKIYMPYGSSLDGDIYYIGLCDSCIGKKVKEGIIKQV